MQETDRIDDYILKHIDGESEYLKALYRDTHVRLLRPRMASGHLQGRLLTMLVRMIRPRRILEIGTYSGYSALCMAEGLPEGSLLHDPLRYEVTMHGRWRIYDKHPDNSLIKEMRIASKDDDTILTFPLAGKPEHCEVRQDDPRTIAIVIR